MTRGTQLRPLRSSLYSLHHGCYSLNLRPSNLLLTTPLSASYRSWRLLQQTVSTQNRIRMLSSSPAPEPKPSSPRTRGHDGDTTARGPVSRRRPPSRTTLEPTASAPIVQSAANPPATTRPPALNLPVRQPSTSTFSHLFHTGKAYLTFYKTGLSQILTNTRLVRAIPPADASPATRSAALLRARWRHDISRLPLFALLLLVCGEFTPLVVLAVPRIVPLTCRIPAQRDALLRKTEARRAAAFRDWEAGARRAALRGDTRTGAPVGAEAGPGLGAAEADPSHSAVQHHVCRSLGLTSRLWDRVGYVPGLLAATRASRRMRFLARDDALLARAGGAAALEVEEVRLACADRGIDVLDRTEQELRTTLAKWLGLTTRDGLGEEEVAAMIWQLLTTRPEAWLAASPSKEQLK